MKSRTMASVLFLVLMGMIFLPVLSLPYSDLDWAAFSQPYETTTTPVASSTATITLTPTSIETSTETPTATMALTSTFTPTATVEPEPTPTSTPTTGPGNGSIAGKVKLQGRSDATGAQIDVDGVAAGSVQSNGDFLADVAPGTHQVRARMPGYLPAQKASVVVESEQTTTLSAVQLRGGDVNNDNKVGLLDLVTVAAAYNTEPPADPRGDINNDGRINLFDLVLVAGNYWLEGPTEWP